MPTPAVTRELSVTYAGVTLGGTDANNLLFDRHRVFGSYETIGFEGRVVVRAATEAAFATACLALETAFTTPNGTLTITQGSSTMRSFGHSANTGFLGRPSFRKVGGPEDSGRARLYEVSVTAQRPADANGGLRIAEFELRTSFSGTRSYRVIGTYTALSGSTAKAKYDAAITALLTSFEGAATGSWTRLDSSVRWDDQNKVANFTYEGVEQGLRDARYEVTQSETGLRAYRITGSYPQTDTDVATTIFAGAIGNVQTDLEDGLTGAWERGAVQYQYDQLNKICTFQVVGEEIGFAQASGVLDNAAIKGQRLLVARRTLAPGDVADATRPVELVVSYEASVARAQTTDLKALWTSTIRPWLVTHAINVADSSTAAILEETPRFDYPQNRISAVMLIQAFSSSPIIGHTITTEETDDLGRRLVGVWSDDPLEFEEFQGKRIMLRTILEEITRIDVGGGAAAMGPVVGGQAVGGGNGGGIGEPPDVAATAPGYRLLQTMRRRRPIRVGVPDYGVAVSIESYAHYLQYRNPAKGRSGGGGSSITGGDGGRIATGIGIGV